jgi:transposase-like protein
MERRKFTREFKLEAVKLIRDRGVKRSRPQGEGITQEQRI